MHAQATRTWVSGLGDDNNPCSRAAPCKTFAGAISKTAPGGEIDVLDPGGFGTLTITKSITIDGGGGQVASVLAVGTNAINVAAGPNDVVKLQNLRLNGVGLGLSGIRFISGKSLQVENCSIVDFTQNGIDIALNGDGAVHVAHTVVKNIAKVGIRAANSGGTTQLTISDSQVTLSGIGIEAADTSKVLIANSVIDNSAVAGVQADTTAGGASVFIGNSDLSFNAIAIQSGPGDAQVSVSNSRLVFNGVRLKRVGGDIFVHDVESEHEERDRGKDKDKDKD